MSSLIRLCAKGVGVEVETTYSDGVAEVEPPRANRRETTLAEAEVFWEQALKTAATWWKRTEVRDPESF